MTISGEFDAGKTPKLIVTASNRNAKWLQTAGNRALILLACDGDRFSLYPERAEFMPGDHASICAVKDFLSPLLLDTAKAVQATREGEGAGKGKELGNGDRKGRRQGREGEMSDRAKCVILVPANYGIEPECERAIGAA